MMKIGRPMNPCRKEEIRVPENYFS